MPLRKGGRRGAVKPKGRIDRIERILEGLVQVVQDAHNNNNHDNTPQQPDMQMPGVEIMNRTMIKQSTAKASNFLWNARSHSRGVLALMNREGVRSFTMHRRTESDFCHVYF